MTGLWRRWSAFLARKEEGTSLALMRILVGLVVIRDLLGTWWSGALTLIWGDVHDTPDGYRTFVARGLFALLGKPHLATVEAVVAATVTAAALLVLGVVPRLAAFVALQGCLALFALDPLAGGGHDRVITNALWLLVLADCGRTLSLGCRARTGRWIDASPVPAWPRALVVLQLVVMYVTTGLQKMAPEWFPWGRCLAVYNMLLTPEWARYDLAPVLGHVAPLAQVASVATQLWECTFWAVGLELVRRGRPGRVRTVYALLGVTFHVGLALLTELGPFSWISLALYPALVTPDEWRAVARWAMRRSAARIPAKG